MLDIVQKTLIYKRVTINHPLILAEEELTSLREKYRIFMRDNELDQTQFWLELSDIAAKIHNKISQINRIYMEFASNKA